MKCTIPVLFTATSSRFIVHFACFRLLQLRHRSALERRRLGALGAAEGGQSGINNAIRKNWSCRYPVGNSSVEGRVLASGLSPAILVQYLPAIRGVSCPHCRSLSRSSGNDKLTSCTPKKFKVARCRNFATGSAAERIDKGLIVKALGEQAS